MKRKTFEDMSKGWPQLEELRQLRHARDKMRKVKLAVGADGRNRTVLWPFKCQDIADAAESVAVDFLASSVAALADQARAGDGRRLRRLLFNGIFNRRIAVRSALRADQQHARHVSERRSLSEFRQARRCRAKHGDQDSRTPTVRDKYKVMLLATQYGMSA